MGMWVEGYSMYEKERWNEAERYGKEIGRSEGLNEGMSKGRETATSQIAENLKRLGVSEDVIRAATTLQ